MPKDSWVLLRRVDHYDPAKMASVKGCLETIDARSPGSFKCAKTRTLVTGIFKETRKVLHGAC